MRAQQLGVIVVVVFGLVAGLPVAVRGLEYYVATDGLDTNLGTIGSPFATIEHAVPLTMPGDTIYMRGGTYSLNTKITIQSKSGTEDNPIRLWAYPGESPILDFAAEAYDDNNRGVQLSSSADWWHLKGLTIQNAGDNGLNTNGDHGVFEQIVTRYNRDSGFQLGSSASNNLILNCDSYENYDPETGKTTMRGENADGFAVKSASIGMGNIFRGDRSFRNADDGWDMFEARANGVLIENSWSYNNGVDLHPDDPGPFGGDGNGFKLGHDSGSHVLVRDVAWDNPQNGFDINGDGYKYKVDPVTKKEVPDVPNGNLSKVLNSTAFSNGLASGANFRFDENLAHVLRNNVSFDGGVLIALKVIQQLNTWNNIPVDADDFLSLDDAIARGARRADGSLPISAFLRLKSNSNLVDSGTPIIYAFNGVSYNVSFNGSSPDLGAFEEGGVSLAVPGDYNGDYVVDAADYAVWRDHLNTSTLLPNDLTPGTVSASDYDVWKAHYGQTPGGGAGATDYAIANAAVPEPGGWLAMAVAFFGLALFRGRG